MQKGIMGGRKTSDLYCSKCLDHGKLMTLFEFSSHASRVSQTRLGTSRTSPPGRNFCFILFVLVSVRDDDLGTGMRPRTPIRGGAFVRFAGLSFAETCAFGGGLP
jgi:hypothetical protein